MVGELGGRGSHRAICESPPSHGSAGALPSKAMPIKSDGNGFKEGGIPQFRTAFPGNLVEGFNLGSREK